jgi:predicted dehydrogenase
MSKETQIFRRNVVGGAQDNGRLRVGLLGCGWVSQHHLRAWQSLGGQAEVVALADPSADALNRRGQEFGIDRRYTTAFELLQAGEIDAVDVATPRETHADMVRLVTSRGLPVLCQKPLAPTLCEAEALVEDVAPLTRLMVHENWRFRPYVRDMKRHIESGAIGVVKQCSLTLFNSGFIPDEEGRLPAVTRQPFFAYLDRMLVTEVLIHHIDALRYMFGSLDLKASNVGHSVSQIVGDDYATIVMQGRGAPGPSIVVLANMAAYGYPARMPDEFVILGQRGTLALRDNVLTLKTGSGETQTKYDPDAVYAAAYAGAIGHFVSALRSGAPFETSPEDNLETLRLVEAIYSAGGG